MRGTDGNGNPIIVSGNHNHKVAEAVYPKSRVIDFVVPGIIGLILQLLTVTLMACTIARERESGTLTN